MESTVSISNEYIVFDYYFDFICRVVIYFLTELFPPPYFYV